MADKKLNEVTKVTDMAYVPVIMADGSVGQIAKSDLASVVAEQMGNPLATSRKSGSENDFNLYTSNGIYSVDFYEKGNSPSPSSYNGILIVTNNRIGQTLQFAVVSEAFFFRTKTTSNVWSKWYQLSSTAI